MDINKEEIKKAQDKIATYQKEKKILEGNIFDLTNEEELSVPLQYGLKAMREKVKLLNTQIKICEDMIETLTKLEKDSKQDTFVRGYEAVNRDQAVSMIKHVYKWQNKGYKINKILDKGHLIGIEYIKEDK